MKGNLIRKKMVGWYNVKQLAQTGIKLVVSSTFGAYADKREIQAGIYGEQNKCYDHHSPKDDVWIDYIADLGDGFDSTFTMAKLLAEKEIEFEPLLAENEIKQESSAPSSLPQASIIVMGGDEVYPTATREEYQNRLLEPYKAAFPEKKDTTPPKEAPDLFAIPGNHDWYDGLTNFLKIFCQQRSLGSLQTHQQRSYFAIKLPHNWWLWGIDIQLDADIDKPQKDYFDAIGEQMDADSKVILCTAEPSWVYKNYRKKDTSYNNLKYFEQKYIIDKGFALPVTIAGDLHHYVRYEGAKSNTQKITAGGGGAFLHPTHNLPTTLLQLREKEEFELQKRFPEKHESKKLLKRTFRFNGYNREFALFLGCFYLFFVWMLQSASNPSYFKHARDRGIPDFWDDIVNLFINSPFVVFIILILVGGLTAFTDTNSGKRTLTWLAGFLHGITQVLVFFWFIRLLASINSIDAPKSVFQVFVFSVEVVLINGLIGGFIMGIYLYLTNRYLGIHDNEAFSSLKWEGYKNFLRLHITKDALTIYPIGVKKIVHWNKQCSNDVTKEAQPHLIEKPIIIKA